MIYKTFDEWKIEGCVVIKGQKSHKRTSSGVALFSNNQVTLNNTPSYLYQDSDDYYTSVIGDGFNNW